MFCNWCPWSERDLTYLKIKFICKTTTLTYSITPKYRFFPVQRILTTFKSDSDNWCLIII